MTKQRMRRLHLIIIVCLLTALTALGQELTVSLSYTRAGKSKKDLPSSRDTLEPPMYKGFEDTPPVPQSLCTFKAFVHRGFKGITGGREVFFRVCVTPECRIEPRPVVLCCTPPGDAVQEIFLRRAENGLAPCNNCPDDMLPCTE